ncbi:MAG TPA: RHS repeat-associated core domain-containing protein, partial [Kofleriaceae bacterium]|nr:RHS repeat-associated core domain-containing protein [Kofleriaceae bacterium]
LPGLFDSYFLYDEQSRVTCETTDSKTTCPTSGTDIKNNHDLSPPFMSAGDWKHLLRPVPGSSGGLVNDFNSSGTGYGSSHQVTDVNQSDGTPALGHTAMAYDARGLRSYDDNTTTLTNDRRDYTYDARRNVINVRGQYYTGSAWHYYDVASAFDHKNRRVFKSFYDETTTKTATWFFYYDPLDRLTEARYTPDIAVSGTYSNFDLVWLGQKLVLYWQRDYVSNSLSATSKRYVASDETDRPIQLWNWPSSGDATRVWAVNPSAWGFDKNIVGPTIYQPLLFTGQYQDVETASYENDGGTTHRPALELNGNRTYDPNTGDYVQLDLLVDQTWNGYGYANSNPVGASDATGLMTNGGSSGDGGAWNCTSEEETIVIDGSPTDVISIHCKFLDTGWTWDGPGGSIMDPGDGTPPGGTGDPGTGGVQATFVGDPESCNRIRCCVARDTHCLQNCLDEENKAREKCKTDPDLSCNLDAQQDAVKCRASCPCTKSGDSCTGTCM